MDQKVNRENNYEYLRVVCCFAVVILHIADFFIEKSVYFSRNIMVFVQACMDFCVPCFLMLSGAFNLSNHNNSDYRLFYKKVWKRTGILFVVFALGYFVYTEVLGVIGSWGEIKNVSIFLVPVLNLLKGKPFYHMWYLFMMIGIYLVTPFLIDFKEKIGDRKFAFVGGGILISAVSCSWMMSYRTNWDFGYSLYFCGYYILGYSIRQRFKDVKMKRWNMIMVVVCLLVLISVTALLKIQFLDNYINMNFTTSFSPTMILISLGVFCIFSNVRVNYSFFVESISRHSYVIYLVHAGIWDIIKRIMNVFGYDIPINIISLAVSCFIVILMSIMCSIIINKLLNRNKSIV